MSLFTKIFGTASQRELKSIYPIADKVDALEEEYKALTDAQLQAKTPEFKARLANGETLDDILPEAFAACREAAWRVLGMRPYRVQVVGGIVLHQGRIAEMKTGEGKTLVATLPAYLDALAGKGVHIVTVNDYLAKRDSEWMGKVFRFMGLTVGLVIHGVMGEAKKAAYQADSQAHKSEHLTHPLGVTLGQIVVDGDDVNALAGQCIQISREGSHQGLTFAGLHLGDTALMQYDAAHHLDPVGTHAQHTPGGLTAGGKGFGQNVVKGLTVGKTLLKFGGLGLKLGVRQGFVFLFQTVNLVRDGVDGLQFPLGGGTKELCKQTHIQKTPLSFGYNTT